MAGTTAAEMIRQNDPDGTIAIISDEPYHLYSRVMLSKPNFFLGKIDSNAIWMKGESWYLENKIDFLGGKTASDLNVAEKSVTLSSGEKVQYEKLLLSTGVSTRKLSVPGAEKTGVCYLRTLDEGKAIMEKIKSAKRAVTVGGGFIGFEMADLMHLAGLDTTMLLRESRFWEPTLDETSSTIIENSIVAAGVKILKNVEISEILGDQNITGVKLNNGKSLETNMVLCGIGVTNQTDWIKQSGVAINRSIVANEYLETNLPNIWTAGDIAEYRDILLEETLQAGNWVSAKEQGRIAGLGMVGKREPFKFVSFYTTQGFGVSIAFVGDVRFDQNRQTIPRGTPGTNSYGQIIVDEKGQVIGATLLNRTSEMTTIAKLVEQNINVSSHLADLANPEFDLKQLLANSQ